MSPHKLRCTRLATVCLLPRNRLQLHEAMTAIFFVVGIAEQFDQSHYYAVQILHQFDLSTVREYVLLIAQCTNNTETLIRSSLFGRRDHDQTHPFVQIPRSAHKEDHNSMQAITPVG